MSTTTTNTYTMDNEIKVNSVKDATAGVSTDWYRSYGQHGVYAKKAGIDFQSNMIWGSQFDQTIIWMKDVRNTTQGNHVYYVINSTGMQGTSSTKTGQVKVKNIYDLSGGIEEATPTAMNTRVYTTSGGSYVLEANRFSYGTLPTRSHFTYGNQTVNSLGSSRLVLF